MVNIISWQIKHNLVKKSVPGQLEAKSMAQSLKSIFLK